MNSSDIQQFIQDNSQLFWWIKPEEKAEIKPAFLVETILNYGNERSVKKLFDLLGIQQVEQFSATGISATCQLSPAYHPLFHVVFSAPCA